MPSQRLAWIHLDAPRVQTTTRRATPGGAPSGIAETVPYPGSWVRGVQCPEAWLLIPRSRLRVAPRGGTRLLVAGEADWSRRGNRMSAQQTTIRRRSSGCSGGAVLQRSALLQALRWGLPSDPIGRVTHCPVAHAPRQIHQLHSRGDRAGAGVGQQGGRRVLAICPWHNMPGVDHLDSVPHSDHYRAQNATRFTWGSRVALPC